MFVTKIRVKNFRLLQDISVDLEKELSLIIGKNNSGKTSLLLILKKFLGSTVKPPFKFDDFNIKFKADLEETIKNDDSFIASGISLKVFIEYDDKDNLSNIGNKVIMDLDPKNNTIVLGFEYYLSEEKFQLLKQDYKEQAKEFVSFLKDQHSTYFQVSKKSIFFDTESNKEDDENFVDLVKENISIDKIINFKYIDATRNVSNKDSDNTLSSLSSKIYNSEETKGDLTYIESFKKALMSTDKKLDIIYADLFKDILDDVNKFGGMHSDETSIAIKSSLQHRELLKNNSTVMYQDNSNHRDTGLPESYNGLGYMNLISMIFQIKILLYEFQIGNDEKASDINLLFIEEPEVHTHPQMQYVFIKNIKSILQKSFKEKSLQTVLSTHSAHIVSDSDFRDIKYFKREGSGVVSKNLKDLKKRYENDSKEQDYGFLKKYLTLNRSDLFFADKAIFIEGDTERILLPAIMKNFDQGECNPEKSNNSTPLLSQNISIISVGNYSQIFEKFIDFIGIKVLIITDIDSVNKEKKSCIVNNGDTTSNASLKHYLGEESITKLHAITFKNKALKNESNKWVADSAGYLRIAYQTKEKADTDAEEYCGRSFEDAFWNINEQFIQNNKGTFQSVPQEFLISNGSKLSAYEMAGKIKKKTDFAIEILLSSNGSGDNESDANNWKTPSYIKESLRWLKED